MVRLAYDGTVDGDESIETYTKELGQIWLYIRWAL